MFAKLIVLIFRDLGDAYKQHADSWFSPLDRKIVKQLNNVTNQGLRYLLKIKLDSCSFMKQRWSSHTYFAHKKHMGWGDMGSMLINSWWE